LDSVLVLLGGPGGTFGAPTSFPAGESHRFGGISYAAATIGCAQIKNSAGAIRGQTGGITPSERGSHKGRPKE